MIRLLHLSDLHLNAGFANKKVHVRKQLKEGLLIAFNTALHWALTHKIDGILITGDLFDHPQINYNLEKQFLKVIEEVLSGGIHVFCVTGNHDPMNTMPFLKKILNHPHFHLFEDDQVKRIAIEFGSGEICEFVGCGHMSKNEQRDLIKTYPVKSNENYWVGIAHASVSSAKMNSDKMPYMGTELETINALNYDYFALGHIHIQQMLTNRCAYAGNLQGINYKETGKKGGLLITLDGADISVRPQFFNMIQWEQRDFVLSDDVNMIQSVEQRIIDYASDIASDSGISANHLILRISLSGRCKCYRELKSDMVLEEMAEAVADSVGLLHVDIKDVGIMSAIDEHMLKTEQTLLALCLKMMTTADEDSDLMNKLYALPIFESSMTETARHAKVMRLLKETRSELIDRMMKENNEIR